MTGGTVQFIEVKEADKVKYTSYITERKKKRKTTHVENNSKYMKLLSYGTHNHIYVITYMCQNNTLP